MVNYLLSSIAVSHREEFDAVVMARGGRKIPVVEAKKISTYHRHQGPTSTITKALRMVPGNYVYQPDRHLSLSYYHDRAPVSADPLWHALLAHDDASATGKPSAGKRLLKLLPDDGANVGESYGLNRAYASDIGAIDGSDLYRRLVIEYNLQRAIFLRDMESIDTLKAFMNRTVNEGDFDGALVAYLHGLFIEGVHFNKHKRDELTHVVNALRLEGCAEDRDALVARKLPSKDAVPQFDWRTVEHVYITIGNVVITTCISHDDWYMRQVSTDFDEAVFCERWSAYMAGHYQDVLEEQQQQYEKLQRELIDIENQIGRTQSVIKAIKTGSALAVRDSLLKIQNIPEIERIELRQSGLRLFTKDMMALRESSGAERYCGRFEIAIGFDGYVAIRNIASFSDDWRNPHGSCLGSFGRLFSSALRELDYYALVLALMEYYRRVDEDHDDVWSDIPASKKPPKVTYCSTWQVIAKAASTGSKGSSLTATDQEMWEASLGTHPPITLDIDLS